SATADGSANTRIKLHDMQVCLTEKAQLCGAFAEPSDGLEPATPPYHVLRSATRRNPPQRFRLVSAALAVYRFATDCHRLHPRGSIRAPSFVRIDALREKIAA
ncbi:MAG TPA: hypothetical protein VGM80_07030, partial [Gaiellaceae bacterium]